MTRRSCKGWALHSVLVVAGLCAGAFANAETILDDNVMVTVPWVPRVEELGLSAPGRWTITVTDLAWPQALQSLSFALTDNNGVLASRNSAGALWFDVVTPTTLFATVFATPNALIGAGLYHINIDFTSAVAPVPLPAAAWLLLSGLCGIVALRRKHTTVTNSVVQ
jgi:hypothetical protein